MTSAPLLTATPSGDVLELRPGGSWIAVNAVALEQLSATIAPQLDQSAIVRFNMAEVGELDTLGAWLLERMTRRVASAGHRANVIGLADNYVWLIE